MSEVDVSDALQGAECQRVACVCERLIEMSAMVAENSGSRQPIRSFGLGLEGRTECGLSDLSQRHVGVLAGSALLFDHGDVV